MGPVKDSTRPDPVETKPAEETQTFLGQDRASETAPSMDTTLAEEQVRELVEHIQENIDKAVNQAHSVGFRFDDRIEDFVIEIHDEQGDLVKQYPPEIVLNLHQKMAELTGMVVDERT